MAGLDPDDINQGQQYVFLQKDATEIMRRNKRKVRYVFLDEEEKKHEKKSEKAADQNAEGSPGRAGRRLSVQMH